MVFADDSQQASKVAGGLYNPVILKRFTLAWRADEQLQYVDEFYGSLESKLNLQLDYKIKVLRRFASIEEQNNWFEAADKPKLNALLDSKIIDNTNEHINAPFGYGTVKFTGRVATATLVERYQDYLLERGLLLNESFKHEQLEIASDYFTYKNIRFKKLVFAEGYGLKHNPYLSYLPLNGTKGELLTIHAPDLKEEQVIKSSVFIIPLGMICIELALPINGKIKPTYLLRKPKRSYSPNSKPF